MSAVPSFVAAVLLALVVASVLVVGNYRRELGSARERVGRGGRIAQTSAGPIEYAEQGTGIPLLASHGAGGGYDQGLAVVGDLVDHGVRIIAPSRFGYLGTPAPAGASPETQADAHAALLAALQIDKAIVLGISAGAPSAIGLALRHPERVAALILIVPGTYAPSSPVAVEGSRASAFVLWLVNTGADFIWWALEKLAPSILVRFVGIPPDLFARASQAEQDRVRQMLRDIEPLSCRFRGINLDSNPGLHPLPLETIEAPTLIISARDDLFNTAPAAEYAAMRIPRPRLVIFESGGHLLMGHRQELRQLIAEFLAKGAALMQPAVAENQTR
ncbi:alpha/beta hydrolase [Bradyrhizobium sp. HKCCYLS1011]|uniref:alpha/beta fold hydrolase n=1 Tax=Bradyrhizobium sp. HKCCYLS1011 TaxID=3420733 RepID=UPI003EB979AC